MFISKAEKKQIIEALLHVDEVQDTLTSKLDEAYTLIARLNRRLAKLEDVAPVKMESKHKSKWTPERRAEQAERIKKMWAKKREAKSPANTVVGVPV
jgi:chorismate mutase